MQLTKEQIQTLRSYKENPDDDNIRIKEICKKHLIEDPLIIYLLNNKELEETDSSPDEYLKENILNNYLIHPTQHNVANFICLGTESFENVRGNEAMKKQHIIFYILCEEKTNIEELTGIGRHDLISARIKHIFNRTTLFGNLCYLIDERENTTDNDYATRTLIFEMKTDNNLSKTVNGITAMHHR